MSRKPLGFREFFRREKFGLRPRSEAVIGVGTIFPDRTAEINTIFRFNSIPFEDNLEGKALLVKRGEALSCRASPFQNTPLGCFGIPLFGALFKNREFRRCGGEISPSAEGDQRALPFGNLPPFVKGGRKLR